MNINAHFLELHFFIKLKIPIMRAKTRKIKTRAISMGTHHTNPPTMEKAQHPRILNPVPFINIAVKIPQRTHPPVILEAAIM